MRRLAVGVLALAVACGGAGPRSALEAPTLVLVIVEGLEPADLAPGSPGALAAPGLADLATGERAVLDLAPVAPSRSAFAASLLTGLPVAEHGLRSPTELGAQRLAPEATTLAERLAELGWLALGAATADTWGPQGLARGLADLAAPASGESAPGPEAVGAALAARLEPEVGAERGLLVVLHHGAGGRRSAPEPDAQTLERVLAPWRGRGGEVDEVFAEQDEEASLAVRLSRRFGRRTDDPRCAALLAAERAAWLGAVDGALSALLARLEAAGRREVGLVVAGAAAPGGPGVLLRRGAAPLALPHLGERGAVRAWLEAPLAAPRRSLAVEVEVDAELRVTLLADEPAGWTGWTGEEGEEGGEGAAPLARVEVAPGERREPMVTRRDAGLRLRLEGSRLFQVPAAAIALGGTTLATCDLPELVALRSPAWPENALVGPAVDLQKAGPRRMSAVIDAPPGSRVELLLEGWPEDPALADGVLAPDATVARDPLRPGAVWIRGEGRLEVEFDTRAPSARLAVLCRIDGERVDRSRMRYLERVLAAPERTELVASQGAWLDPALRGDPAPTAVVRVRWRDEAPLPAAFTLPSPADLAALRRPGSDG